MKGVLKAGIRLFSDDSGKRELLGFADLAVAGLIVARGLRVLKKKDGEPYVAFPMRRSKAGSFFEVVSPATPKARELIKTAVLRAYKNAAARAS